MWFSSGYLHQAMINSCVESRALWVNAYAVRQVSSAKSKKSGKKLKLL